MTTNRSGGWGAVLMVIALAAFLTVSFFIAGGWLFSVTWGAFMVPVFALPSIDIGQGIAAIILLWLVGLSARGTRTSKKDD